LRKIGGVSFPEEGRHALETRGVEKGSNHAIYLAEVVLEGHIHTVKANGLEQRMDVKGEEKLSCFS